MSENMDIIPLYCITLIGNSSPVIDPIRILHDFSSSLTTSIIGLEFLSVHVDHAKH